MGWLFYVNCFSFCKTLQRPKSSGKLSFEIHNVWLRRKVFAFKYKNFTREGACIKYKTFPSFVFLITDYLLWRTLLLIEYFRLKYCQWVLISSVLSMWVIHFGDPSKCVCDTGGSGRTQWKISAPFGIDWISFPFWLKVGACIVSQDRVILGKVTQNSWFLHKVCNCTKYYHVSYNTCNQ
jgi:hypothetical protein